MTNLRQFDRDLLFTVNNIINRYGLFIASPGQQGSKRSFSLFFAQGGFLFLVRRIFDYNIIVAVCFVDFPYIIRKLDIFFLIFPMTSLRPVPICTSVKA